MNYKNYLKPLAKVKDLMLTCSGGKAEIKEEYKKNEWWENATDYNVGTFLELNDFKVSLIESYTLHRTDYNSEIFARYILDIERPDGILSRLDISHNFGYEYKNYYDGKMDKVELNSNRGFFDSLKPSELPTFYRTLYFLAYDRRKEAIYQKLSA